MTWGKTIMPLAYFRALMRQALRKARALESEIKYPRPEGTEVEIVNQPAENVAEPHFYPTHMWREGSQARLSATGAHPWSSSSHLGRRMGVSHGRHSNVMSWSAFETQCRQARLATPPRATSGAAANSEGTRVASPRGRGFNSAKSARTKCPTDRSRYTTTKDKRRRS
jgi:hypothetical protein